MTAADRREELEATIWRGRGGASWIGTSGAQDVDRILAAADKYAQACADDAWAAAEGQARLAVATAERMAARKRRQACCGAPVPDHHLTCQGTAERTARPA